MIEQSTYLFFNVCRIVTLTYLVNICLPEKRCSHKMIHLIAFTYCCINTASFLYYANPILNLSLMLIFFICLTACHLATLQRKIIIAVSLTILCMIYETAIFSLFIKVVGAENMSLFSQTTLVLMLLFSASILKKIYPSQIDSNLKSVYWLLLTLMPIGSIMILVLLYTVTVDCWQCTIIAGILLTFNLCTIYIYASAVNSMEAQKQTEALQLMNDSYHAQLETLRFSQTKVHALQHDMKNHVLAMQSLFHSRQESELEAYFNRFQDELKWDKQWVKTGEIAIDSFLNYKLLQIEKLGTNISCKTLVENLSGFDLFDLCAILSNLLDNAYKALSCTNHRALRLDMKTEKMVLYITLYNTSDKKMIQKNGHFISDKRNTQSHGYGLRNVQNLSEKYHGIFHLASSGDGVTAQLMLYPQLKM